VPRRKLYGETFAVQNAATLLEAGCYLETRIQIPRNVNLTMMVTEYIHLKRHLALEWGK